MPKSELDKILQATHPCRDKLLTPWNTFLKTYEGGIAVKDLLIRHAREPEDSFESRQSRTFYMNVVRTILETYNAFIFNKAPVRSFSKTKDGGIADVPEDLSAFYKNVDSKGNDINEFMRTFVSLKRNLYGHVHVVVDMPSFTETEVVTEQDRVDKEIRPYLYTIDPQRVLNWSTDGDDKYHWIRWEEDVPGVSDPFSSEILHFQDRDKKKRVRTWARDKWVLHEIQGDDVKVIREGPNPLGEVPVVTVKHRDSSLDPKCGLSAINDLAFMNIAIYQWLSLLDEELFSKVMNILAVQQTVASETPEIMLSNNNVLTYTGVTPPLFISPSSAPAQTILESIDRVKGEMLVMARLAGPGAGGAGQSGISQAFDFNETNQALGEQAQTLGDAENEIHRLWATWMNLPWEGTIQYPEEFGVEILTEEVETLTAAVEAIQSTTFASLLKTRTALKFVHGESEEVKQKITEEIKQHEEESALISQTLRFQGLQSQEEGEDPDEPLEGQEDKDQDNLRKPGETN